MVMPPVMPRPEQLPLNEPNWSWDRFEAFCLDLISLFAEVKNCHRYGKRGDFQRGIDIFADLENGERWVFQCKRYKQFTDNLTQKAIQTVTYTANKYILLLSCEATSKVRDEVDKHQNWDVWNVQDISSKVRGELLPDVARRLVETHFSPEWRRAFLGLAGLVTFVSPADFFHRLLNPNNLLDEVDRTLERIAKFPDAWAQLSPNTRRCRTVGFPYGIVYQVRNERILVVAVMHLQRKPKLY